MITNWEWLEKTAKGRFDRFIQSDATLHPFKKTGNEIGMPIAKVGSNWPDDDFIPLEHIKIERVTCYRLMYKQNLQGVVYESSYLTDFGYGRINPVIIGSRVERDFDDVAFYNPILN